MGTVRLSLERSIIRGAAAAALTILAASSAQAASVKEVFEKYDLLGTLAADCSQPADAKSLYVVNRAIDADHVQLDQMVGLTSRQFAAIIDKASESKPNEIALSYTIDDQRYNLVVRAEHARMRTMESARATGEKQIVGGRDGGTETPWYGRCQQSVTIHSSPEGGGRCIEVLGEIKARARLQMWDCNDTPPQIFTFDTLNGQLAVVDLCVDTEGGGGQQGATAGRARRGKPKPTEITSSSSGSTVFAPTSGITTKKIVLPCNFGNATASRTRAGSSTPL